MVIAAGASNLYFSRETKVYIQQGTNIWEVPVLTNYTYSQATNTSSVTLAEMSDSAGTSRRGQAMFTDSRAPANWSFSTYVRPFKNGINHRAVEEVLWANFVAQNSYDPTAAAGVGAWFAGLNIGTSELAIDFNSSNKTTLGEFDIYFVLGASRAASANYLNDGDTAIYKISNAAINEVALNFEIDGIATLAWTGMGGTLREVVSYDASAAITLGTALTSNFIRNRITQMAVVSSVSGSSKTYAITLTGGSMTITNNMTYLTPAVMGRVNTPLGHITGTRTVSGSFTAYLDEKTNGTMDLFEDIAGALTSITNHFALDFYVGGKAAGDAPRAPGMQIKIPNAHITLPAIDIQDVVSVTVDFTALPSSMGTTDEITKISYVGA